MDLTKVAVVDIETNGLLSELIDYSSLPYKISADAKLWCVVIHNVGTGEKIVLVNEEITAEAMKKSLAGFTHIVAHNGIKFDFITLMLFGVFDYKIGRDGNDTLFGNPVRFICSLILSRIVDPSKYGGHSLEVWGNRLGFPKTDFRALCVEKGYITKDAPKGAEFRQFCQDMVDYCVQDTIVNVQLFLHLMQEIAGQGKHWSGPLIMETKLANYAIRREIFGFNFNKTLAIEHFNDLTSKIEDLHKKVDPILPLKPLNKGETDDYTLPKNQFKKDGSPSANLVKKLEALGADLLQDDSGYQCYFQGRIIPLPYDKPLLTHRAASIEDLDHVKMYLIHLGWVPLEWRERDLTVDSKKQKISYEKRIKALNKWYEETVNGKYSRQRFEYIFEEYGIQPADVLEIFSERLQEDRPLRIPTSPCVRVGVEKELCPNLVALGDKVDFAKDFTLFLTYRHRKSCIAGGEVEEMDFDEEAPNTGYLANLRLSDGRIPTPAIEIGANTFRYKHIAVANVPRTTSLYGYQMRELFGCGDGYSQLGFDFSSLEARITGHYVWMYDFGPEYAKTLLAEKPGDVHSVTAQKMGISRTDAKSINYAIIYGAQPKKLAKMLGVTLQRAKEIYNEYWDAVPALKALKIELEQQYELNGKQFIVAIDGRLIRIRSKHSIINALFQSAGAIAAKYVTVDILEQLEDQGLVVDPFIGAPDSINMIEYHDEDQFAIRNRYLGYQIFGSEDEAKSFVKDWTGEYQLGSISHSEGIWFVALPNILSIAIEKAISKVGKQLQLNVPLGFEFIVGNNWAECH